MPSGALAHSNRISGGSFWQTLMRIIHVHYKQRDIPPSYLDTQFHWLFLQSEI